jgi:hypothetical protein
MLDITLKRGPSTPTGTYGSFIDENDKHICFSLERPWLENKPRESCVPTGTYLVAPYISQTKGPVYLLQDTAPRSMIEIHSANVYSQLLGCIAPGIGFDMFNVDDKDNLLKAPTIDNKKIKGVTHSKEALMVLKTACNWPGEFWLHIV